MKNKCEMKLAARTLAIGVLAALVLAGAAAGCAIASVLKNPAAKKMTDASGKVSRLLRLLGFAGCMASFFWGRLELAAGWMKLGWSEGWQGRAGGGKVRNVDGLGARMAAQVIVWISQIDLFCTKFQIYWRRFNEKHKNNS